MSDTKIKASGKITSKKIIIALACTSIVLIAILVGVIIRLMQKPENVTTVASDGRGTLVTEENVKSLVDKAQEPVADGYYTTSMNIDWYFDNGKAESSNAYVENDISNTRTVYFDLMLADTGEIVYSSPYIPVGAKLTDFALTTDLAAGDYNAVVKYHLVDDEHNELSTVSVSVTLHILK